MCFRKHTSSGSI